MDQKLFPSVLRVLIEAKDQKANRLAIVQSIQEKVLAEGGTKINNLNEEVKKILQQGVDFGLFNEKNDCFRLIFRPYTVAPSVENDQATTSKQVKKNDDNAFIGQPDNNLPAWASDSDELSANEEFSKFSQEIGNLRKSDLFHIFQALKKPDVDFSPYNRRRKRGYKSKKNSHSKFGGKSRSISRGRRRRRG